MMKMSKIPLKCRCPLIIISTYFLVCSMGGGDIGICHGIVSGHPKLRFNVPSHASSENSLNRTACYGRDVAFFSAIIVSGSAFFDVT